MKELKVGKKTYKLQFGYAVVAKGGIVKRLIKLEEMSENTDFSDSIEDMMGCLDELLLAALQKNHSDEFGYQVRTGNGHDEALDKVDKLLDTYLDSDDADPLGLINDLSDELADNGFLHHMLRKMEELNAPVAEK